MDDHGSSPIRTDRVSMDVFVTRGDGSGSPSRPMLTIAADISSRAILAWSVDHDEGIRAPA